MDGLIIYAINAIEGINRQLRKATKNQTVFPTDDSPFKNVIPGNYGYHKRMDEPPARLGSDSFPVENLLPRKVIIKSKSKVLRLPEESFT